MRGNERIGLFGGTFDPIHFGHLHAAEYVRRKSALTSTLLIPSCVPPHKNRGTAASAGDRLNMVELALEGRTGMSVSSFEVDAGGVSYAVDTLKGIARQYPESRLFYIIGVDAFLEIETWKDYARLLEEYAFIVISRPGYHLREVKACLEEKYRNRVSDISDANTLPDSEHDGANLFLLRVPALDISSTYIRACLRQGKSVQGLVPASVETYIREKRLYREK